MLRFNPLFDHEIYAAHFRKLLFPAPLSLVHPVFFLLIHSPPVTFRVLFDRVDHRISPGFVQALNRETED